MDEFDLIRRYFAPLAAGFPGSLNLTDDAALIDIPAGKELVITKDAISEGIHFLGTEDAGLIARKLLRVNLSDLAAKGAAPLCYMLAAVLPASIDERWIAGFAEGLKADQQAFNIHLAGGDTTSTHGPLSLSLTALGLVDKGKMIKRSGAKNGDYIFVSGTLGDAALGLMSLTGELNPSFQRDDELEQRYFLPQPHVALGGKLQGIASSCMDISDGLVQDLGHICTTSGVGATIHQHKLPLSKSVQGLVEKYPDLWEAVTGGGDDYELLFTAPAMQVVRLEKLAQETGVPITAIGEITSGKTVELLDASGQQVPVTHKGFKHF